MVSKKSKRYRFSRLVSKTSNVNPAENETESSCASEPDTSTHNEKCATLHSPRPTSDKSVTCKLVMNDQSTQSNIATRKPYGFMQSSFWVIMIVHVMVCGDL